VERTACVDIRALPLQLLLRAHPEWRDKPVVVVDRDKPQGVILWANELALGTRILPGLRYAAGLSLSRELCGGTVEEAEIAGAVEEVAQRLWRFSPRIEPSPREAGIFWLDASGLRFLFPSLAAWAESIQGDLLATGFRAVVAVGFSRFGSYAAARSSRENLVFGSVEEERARVRQVPIARLGLSPSLTDTLLKLGIKTLGGFIDLPTAGIVRRFGEEAGELHRLARGEGWEALNAADLQEPIEAGASLDYPENNTERLLAVLTGLLHTLLGELARRHEVLAMLRFILTLDNGARHEEEIAPAAPTLESGSLLMLCRLRLETLSLDSGVVEMLAQVRGVGRSEHQDTLFPETSTRNLEAAGRALAKIRAEYGNDAVVYARLHEGYLPEARYGWEPLQHLTPPKPTAPLVAPLVRRIYTPPIALPPRDHREPDGWLVAGVADGPVEEVIGPHFINGGWWMREIARAYYYVRTRSGRWLWIYHDQKRRRWFLQGEVQ
jgi:protein ImuB